MKDLVKYCKSKSCKFTTKVEKDMVAYKKVHLREEAVDRHCTIPINETNEAMGDIEDGDKEPNEDNNSPAVSKNSDLI